MRMVRERLPDDGLPGGTRTRHEITAQDVTRRVGIAATVAPAEDDERAPTPPRHLPVVARHAVPYRRIRIVLRPRQGREPFVEGGMHEVHDLARQCTMPRRSSSCRASPSSSTPTTDSRFGRETPKTTSRNALQPLSMRVRRISTLKKWVNSRHFPY